MNRFEEYLKEHKEQLESIEVDPRIWTSIENELLRKNNHKIKFYLQIAVSFLILIGIVGIVKYTFYQNKQNPQFTLSHYSNKYGTIEKDFQNAIYYQTIQLENLEIPASLKSDFKVLTNELNDLDKQYKIYVGIIMKHGYNENIGNKVLEYYSLKLELLKKIQFEIIKVSNFKKDKNDENNEIKIQL